MNIAGKILTGAAIAAAAVAYALAAHYTSAAADAALWAVALAAAPIFLALGAFAQRRLDVVPLLLVAAVIGGITALALPTLQKNVGALYFLQHLGINGSLAFFFGRTLRAGHTPLCTVMARHTHRQVSDTIARYTRQVTRAWALFFACVATASVLLFFFAPIEIWSAFANLMTAPLVGLMFVGEYLVRLRILPRDERRGFLAAFRGYRATMGESPATVGGATEAGRP